MTPRPVLAVRTAPDLLLVAVAVLLAGCWPGPGMRPPTPTDRRAIRIGTGQQPESQLLAAVMVELLTAAEVPAESWCWPTPSDARRALELGDVDVLPSYTGEAWLEVLERADPPSDQATSLARVAEADEQRGLVWLRPPIVAGDVTTPPADVTFAFVVDEDGPHADVGTMSQLATRLGQVEAPVLCVDPDFANREDGLPVVLDAYSIAPESVDAARHGAVGGGAGRGGGGLRRRADQRDRRVGVGHRAAAAGRRPRGLPRVRGRAGGRRGRPRPGRGGPAAAGRSS